MPAFDREIDGGALVNGIKDVDIHKGRQKLPPGSPYHVVGTEKKHVLCERCKSLNLAPDKFIIDGSATISRKEVRNSYLPRREIEFSLKSSSSKSSLGRFADIHHKSQALPSCSLCLLVIKSVKDSVDGSSTQTTELGDAVCYMLWEVDGREASKETERNKGRTRRIRLFWSDKRLKDSHLVFVAPEKYYRPNSDAQSVWKNEALFLGRDIQSGGRQSLVKSWVDLCWKSHRGPCRHEFDDGGKFHQMVSQSYFGVIDVLDMRITSLPHSGTGAYDNESSLGTTPQGRYTTPEHESSIRRYAPFIALSHVWGKGNHDTYTTKLSNIMLRRINGSLEDVINQEDFPRAIQDAIHLAKGLGVRYLWIDSLCIVQNSSRSWSLNARSMDLIYGKALLTICAADGKDSSAGLRAMHIEDNTTQHSEDVARGVRLMVSRSPETGIRASTWNTRAWTFQGRLLSKRCLIFTEGRVYFQCLSSGMSEDIFADREGAGWSLDLVNAPLQMLRDLRTRPLW